MFESQQSKKMVQQNLLIYAGEYPMFNFKLFNLSILIFYLYNYIFFFYRGGTRGNIGHWVWGGIVGVIL